jgi:hypothetical protein
MMRSPDRFIARMRDREQSLMTNTVRVTRTSGQGIFDPSTASYGDDTETTVYTGPALVRPKTDAVDVTGGTSVQISNYTVKLPPDTPTAVGDVVTVTGSTHDTGLVGVGLRVLDVVNDEWQIVRRLTCAQQTDRPA